jgi:hypothetical protein
MFPTILAVYLLLTYLFYLGRRPPVTCINEWPGTTKESVTVLNDKRKVSNASRIFNTWLEITVITYLPRHCASYVKSKKTYTTTWQRKKEDNDAFPFISMVQHSHNLSRHIQILSKIKKNAKNIK